MDIEQKILLERAKLTARRNTGPGNSLTPGKENTLLIVEFLLAPERYAINSSFVSEVLSLKEITAIPGAPLFVMGVINLRGKIVSIVNLKKLFNLKEKGLTELNKVILLEHGNMEFGIVADAIAGNKLMELNDLSPPPPTLSGTGAEFISGVSPDGLILLNAESLLTSNLLRVNQKGK